MAIATLGFLIGLCVLLFSSHWQPGFIRPGHLTDSHALILKDRQNSQRCAACHDAASESPSSWLASLFTKTPEHRVSQSTLCLECHQSSLNVTATFAHSIAPDALDAVSERTTLQAATHDASPLTRFVASLNNAQPHISGAEIACSTCHQEHRGAGHQLTDVSNRMCANCHKNSFTRFSAHPEFTNWPSSDKQRVRFTHASHSQQHFPTAKQTFACVDCHVTDSNGTMGAASYRTCASCHDTKIQAGLSDGVSLVCLPCIEEEVVETESKLEQWPESCRGSFDGVVHPLTRILLMSDDRARDALANFGEALDFFDFDADNPDHVRESREIALAIRRLCDELAENPRLCLTRRLTKSLGMAPPPQTIHRMALNLESKRMTDVNRRWFATEPPPAPASSDPENSDTSVSEPTPGDWNVDTTAKNFYYRPLGHADPFMQALIELAFTANDHIPPENLPALASLRSSSAVKQCTSCHRMTPGRVAWTSASANQPRQFTVFSHRPHLVQPELRDCSSCHRSWTHSIGHGLSTRESDGNLVGDGQHPSDFAPITKQTCAACHTPQAAGDSCTKCHRYHVGATPPSGWTQSHESNRLALRRARAIDPKGVAD